MIGTGMVSIRRARMDVHSIACYINLVLQDKPWSVPYNSTQALEEIIERTFMSKIVKYRVDDERTFFENFANDDGGCAYNENVWLSPKLIVGLMYVAYEAGRRDAA